MFRTRKVTRGRMRDAGWLVGAALAVGPVQAGYAQRAQTLNGPPVQVQPYVQEPGVPNVTIMLGTPNPFGALGDGGTGGTGGDGSSGGGSSDALNTMLGTPWGAQSAADAQSLGVNPSALAATCVLESGCGTNVGDGSGAQGVFQMYPAAYQEGLNTALAANPALASQIVPGAAGMNDPVTESIAASGYLMQANQSLQSAGITNPTVVDARGYYEFGPTAGTRIATSSGDTLMSSVVPASYLSSNNIPANTTVSQWQASVAAQVGNAANQTVIT